jgi:DNA-binding MarR family transcriptional regulator
MSERAEDLKRAVRLIGKIYDGLDSRARKHDESIYEGISYAEMRALNAIARLAPLSLGGLAEATAVKPSSASITLERLVVKGLAERRPGSRDRRAVEISLTEAGRKVMEALDLWLEEDGASIFDTLSDGEIPVFVAILEKIAQGLAK